MNHIKLQDEDIKEACALLARDLVREADKAAEGEETKPSQTFLDRMDGIIRKTERRESLRRWRKRGWVSAAMIFLGLFSWLFFDSSARAAVLNWYREVTGKQVIYHFNMEWERDKSVYKVAPTWLPENYTLQEEIWDNNEYLALYMSNLSEKGVIILSVSSIRGGPLVVYSEQNREESKLSVGNYVFDCYIGADGENSDYVWIDEENNCCLSLSSALSHSTNSKILEGLLIED